MVVADGGGTGVEDVPPVDVTGKQYKPFDKPGTDDDLGFTSSLPYVTVTTGDCDGTGGTVVVSTTASLTGADVGDGTGGTVVVSTTASLTGADVVVVGGSCARSFCVLSEDERTSKDNLAPIAK